MNREETRERIKVMQHFADGGEVETLIEEEWRPVISPLWAPTGRYRIKQEEKRGWVNIYPRGRSCGIGSFYNNRQTADAAAGADRIACVEIVFRKGDGLQ